MASLNRLASNWSRVEREKLNTNWSIIENYLSNLQGQINLLTGGVDVQELINQINDILNQGNVIIGDLETALQEATTVIANAQNATTDAQNAAQEALNAINDMQAFINQFGNAETYDNGKLYKANNIVEFNGSGFICVQDTQGNTPPTLPIKRNDWWQLIAQRGVDGTGSVSKVAGKSPDVGGNVLLSPDDIGAASSENLNELQRVVTENLVETVRKGELVINVKDYGAKGDGIADDTVAFNKAIAETPNGGTLYISTGKYKITDELKITKPIRIRGSLAEDQGNTILKFNLDGKTGKVGIRVNNKVHGCAFEDFYMQYVGSETSHDGLLLDGIAGDYPNFIWYTKLSGLYVSGFANNYRFNNVCILSVVNCRSIGAKLNGFNQTGFATGVSFYSCYAQECAADGFKLVGAYYSGCFSCFSDGNKRGYVFENTLGGYVRDSGSESCQFFAIAVKNSSVYVDGITVIESGTDQTSIYRPTALYVESGSCNVKNLTEERLHPSNSRLYTILFEPGTRGTIETTGNELLGIYISYEGKCSVDGQYQTKGIPTGIDWKEKDIGKIVYNQNATEQGTEPNKYIIFGYRRMTSGNGNVLGTDWLPLKANIGN